MVPDIYKTVAALFYCRVMATKYGNKKVVLANEVPTRCELTEFINWRYSRRTECTHKAKKKEKITGKMERTHRKDNLLP